MASHKKANHKPLVKEKRSWSSKLMVAFAAAIGAATFQQFGTSFNESNVVNKDIDNKAFLMNYEKKTNASLPKYIDSITIWESVETAHDEALMNYRIEGYIRNDVSNEAANAVMEMIEPQLAIAVCEPLSRSALFARNITATYIYHWDDGGEIARFSFTSEKCRKIKHKASSRS